MTSGERPVRFANRLSRLPDFSTGAPDRSLSIGKNTYSNLSKPISESEKATLIANGRQNRLELRQFDSLYRDNQK